MRVGGGVEDDWREIQERIKGAMGKPGEGGRGKRRECGGIRSVERRRGR